MRIAMIIPSLSQTGPGIVARDLCVEFVKLGHMCRIFYFDEKYGLDLPCDSQKIEFTGDGIDFKEWDIIHTHGYRPDAYVYRQRNKISKFSCKLVSTLHQPIIVKELQKTYSYPKALIGSILWHRNLSCQNHIAVLNNEVLQQLPITLREKASIVFNGRSFKRNEIDVEDKNLLANIASQYKIIGTNSQIIKRKGLEQIIQALAHLPDFAFVAVGDGEEKQNLLRLAKTINVSDRCFFLGYRKNSTDYLQFYDIFLMCTRSEGFPLALIEAAAEGKSCVISNIQILKDIMSDEIVEFYNLDDIQSLVGSIIKASHDKEGKGVKLQEYYKSNLTSEAMAQRYINIYKSNGL